MPDLVDTLAAEAGKELVKALVAGLLGAVKRVSTLWRRAGKDAEERMATELEHASAELCTASTDAGLVARAEVVWETRLRDLLAAHPEARHELEEILAAIRRENQQIVATVQNVTASGQNSTAQGVIGGNINNYAVTPPSVGGQQ